MGLNCYKKILNEHSRWSSWFKALVSCMGLEGHGFKSDSHSRQVIFYCEVPQYLQVVGSISHLWMKMNNIYYEWAYCEAADDIGNIC